VKKTPKKLEAYRHPWKQPGGPLADDAPGPFYVTAYDPGVGPSKFYLMVGPLPKHQDALDLVEPARAMAESLDPRAVWMAFGTARMAPDFNKPGKLNEKLGVAA